MPNLPHRATSRLYPNSVVFPTMIGSHDVGGGVCNPCCIPLLRRYIRVRKLRDTGCPWGQAWLLATLVAPARQGRPRFASAGPGTAMGVQLKKLAQATASSRKLRRQIAAIEEAIDKEIGYNMKRPRGGIGLFYILRADPNVPLPGALPQAFESEPVGLHNSPRKRLFQQSHRDVGKGEPCKLRLQHNPKLHTITYATSKKVRSQGEI